MNIIRSSIFLFTVLSLSSSSSLLSFPLFLFLLSPLFSPLSPLFSFPTAWKNCRSGQQFCAVGVSIWCLSGSVHFLRRNTVDEDPAQCVYQAVDLTAVGQLIWPNKGGESWSGRTIQGSPDRRTPLLDNLLLIPVPPPHHDLAIDRLLRSNSSSLANAVLFSHATKCQLLRSNSSLWWTQCYFLHATKLSIWLITS